MRPLSQTPTPNKELHRTPPTGFTAEEWWLGVKLSRFALLRDLPSKDAAGKPFRSAAAAQVQRMFHQIDQRAADRVAVPDALTNSASTDRYFVSSAILEATTSSQMDGASTTPRVVADMPRQGRSPSDSSWQIPPSRSPGRDAAVVADLRPALRGWRKPDSSHALLLGDDSRRLLTARGPFPSAASHTCIRSPTRMAPPIF